MGAAMVKHSFHNIEQIPEGKTIGEINPAFSNIKWEVRVGRRGACCTSCRKPFNAARKARREIRLYSATLQVPIAWAYPICGACLAKLGKGGESRDSVLASIESFHYGEQAPQ